MSSSSFFVLVQGRQGDARRGVEGRWLSSGVKGAPGGNTQEWVCLLQGVAVTQRHPVLEVGRRQVEGAQYCQCISFQRNADQILTHTVLHLHLRLVPTK